MRACISPSTSNSHATPASSNATTPPTAVMKSKKVALNANAGFVAENLSEFNLLISKLSNWSAFSLRLRSPRILLGDFRC
mmetsp:Transcript_85615/g.165881  ORF Transcript_85615/g.165881 Transcript_85615/m.165881 type:complete len:80 (+) Transcript_85615:20-259(+)